jgi:hypothetical protein
MANQLYKGHLLLWTANFDEETDAWLPTVQIAWNVSGRYEFHRFKGPPQSSQAAAMEIGKELAELWIDKKL